MTFEEFLNEFKKHYKECIYEFDESTFIDSHTPMRVICKKHGEFWKAPRNILKYECWKCSYEKRAKNYTLTTEEFIGKAQKVHGDKYDYSESIYEGTKIPIIIKCPIHGRFTQIPNDHLSGKGCSVCNESHLERTVKKILDENNIKYIWQYKPEWLGKQSLDFFLPEYNMVIECQGKQHFGFGGWSKNCDFNKIISSDIKKYELVKENDVNILYFINEIDFDKVINNEIYKNNIVTEKNLIECITQKQ